MTNATYNKIETTVKRSLIVIGSILIPYLLWLVLFSDNSKHLINF